LVASWTGTHKASNHVLHHPGWLPSLHARHAASQRAYSSASAEASQTPTMTADEEPKIVVTDKCAQQIRKVQARDNTPDLCLRVEVAGGGCQGFQYNLSLDHLANVDAENDRIFEHQGASVVVDRDSLEIVKGSTVDYKVELIGSAFVVGNNPLAAATCGCNRSFNIQ